MFFGLTFFAMMFTLVVWQYASAELVELQEKTEFVKKNHTKAA